MQTHIIATAMVMFNRDGFEGTTMEAIAEASDIAKATLYRYFPVKGAILAGFWQQKSEGAQSHVEAFMTNFVDTRSRLEAYINAGLVEAMKSHELYSAYFQYRLQHLTNLKLNKEQKVGFNYLVRKILEVGIEANEVRTDLPCEALVAQFDTAASMVMIAWLKSPDNFNASDVITTTVEIFLQGAARDKPMQ